MADDDVTAPAPTAAPGTAPDAAPDVLGEGWSARTLRLRPDAQGEPVATLVHREPTGPAPRRAVLYVHGFVDYFFQAHVGDAFAAHGYDFFALDLRDYGRSIRPGREPNFVTELAAYSEEIDAAVRLLRADHDQLVVLGHSMGGLVTSLWADARRGAGVVDALVLNSPWLELRGSWVERVPVTRLVDVVGRFVPRLKVGALGQHYGAALHSGTGGEWDYDLAWKPLLGFPVRAGWLRTVRRGHARVARGLAVDRPVLVLSSDASGPDDRWHDALVTTDSVLDVEHIAARAPLLGPDVTYVQVAGGAHDLALSPAPARDRYLDEVLGWLESRLG
ncbi:MAG TPA: alpha/beta hydrolase [Cellulomonas sp.]